MIARRALIPAPVAHSGPSHCSQRPRYVTLPQGCQLVGASSDVASARLTSRPMRSSVLPEKQSKKANLSRERGRKATGLSELAGPPK